jgi:hypothetical protein
MHPVVSYFAGEWDRAEREDRPPDLGSLNILEVLEMCKSGAVEHPTWSSLLHFQTLPLLLKKQPGKKWWLGRVEDEANKGEQCLHTPHLS